MQSLDKNTQAFLALVRSGLWETDVRLLRFGNIDFKEVNRLAQEQLVVGLVAAGLEHVVDVKLPFEEVLQFIGPTLKIEQRNHAMNHFIAEIVDKMRLEGIYTLLVKGQGLAQCYERPKWRISGDVDLLLSQDNYSKAKALLLQLSSGNKNEERYSQHLGMKIGDWYVEIHGSLRTGLVACVDKEVDDVQRDVFCGGNVRSWMNGETTVFLPSPNNDVFFVFTHFLKHFYKGGMSLRQVCDWSRLLWTFRDKVDIAILEKRLKRSRLMDEWRGFASLAVEHLGMPVKAMPLYDNSFSRKGSQLIEFILTGNTGNKVQDTWGIAKIFPWKTLCYLPSIFLNWLKVKERLFGEGGFEYFKRRVFRCVGLEG